jgi:hypothetical protein
MCCKRIRPLIVHKIYAIKVEVVLDTPPSIVELFRSVRVDIVSDEGILYPLLDLSLQA